MHTRKELKIHIHPYKKTTTKKKTVKRNMSTKLVVIGYIGVHTIIIV